MHVSPIPSWAARVRGRARRLRAAESGVTAVEFAVAAPVMILVLFALIELPRAVMTGQRASRSIRTMADLISRGSMSSVDDVYAAGRIVMSPYGVADPGLTLSAVGVYPKGSGFEARVCSTVATETGVKRKVNETLGDPPAGNDAASMRYVMAEVRFTYKPTFDVVPYLNSWVFYDRIVWPVRRGTVYKGKAEVVMPGGAACPAT